MDIQAQVDIMNSAGNQWQPAPKFESPISAFRRTNYYHVHMQPPAPSNSGDLMRGGSGEHRKSQSNMHESMTSNWPKESPPEHMQVMTYNVYSPYAQHWNSRLPLITLEIDPKNLQNKSIFPGTSLENAFSQPRPSLENPSPPTMFSEASSMASKMFPKRYKKHITYGDNRKILPRA